MRKKKILWHSGHSQDKTGFGRNTREVLLYLYKTGKYDIVEFTTGPHKWEDKHLSRTPWKTYGAIPSDQALMAQISQDPALSRAVYYGSYFIDEVIATEKPDIYFGVEDIWAFHSYWDKPWWNKFPCVLWTTLDSLPIIQEATDNAHKVKNYWVWASFAEREMHKLGFDHVKTQSAALDLSVFKRKEKWERMGLRDTAGIGTNTVVFGFVFRNQLRKLVPVLLESFKDFRDANPDIDAKLLLHTSFQEGWPIKRLINEVGVDPEDVLNTYVCKQCKNYKIQPFAGQAINCPVCFGELSMGTPNPQLGVTESDLSEIYNIMDFYIHPMTSGGLEIPIVEALASGLPVATVNYSCGEEYCANDFVKSMPFHFYREFGYAAFKKSQPDRAGLAKILEDFAKMPSEEREKIGQLGSDWAREYYSVDKVGKEIEKFIDKQPFSDWDYKFSPNLLNTEYPLNMEIEDPTTWAIDLIKNVSFIEEKPDSPQIKNIVEDLNNGIPRERVYKKVIDAARGHNSKNETLDVKDLVEKNDKKKIAFLTPGSLIDCLLTLGPLEEIYKKNPEADIYIVTQGANNNIFEHLPYIKGFLPYNPVMDDPQWLGGGGGREGIVDTVINPHALKQYTHNE